MKRRDLLRNLALGAAGVSLGSLRAREAAGQTGEAPKRFVLWTTQHGPPRDTWKMSPPGLPAGTGSASLVSLASSDFSRVYAPLHRVRESVSIVEGLSMMSSMIDRTGSDNNHGVAWSNLLVNVPYNGDDPFVGSRAENLHPRPGGASIDHYIGQQTGGGGRLDSVMWSDGGGRFGSKFAFSSNDQGQWIVPNDDPMNAFARLMGTGLLVAGGEEPTEPRPPTRDELVRAARFRAYNTALTQFDRIAPQLGTADQESLVAHRNHLERFGMRFNPNGPVDPSMPTIMCTPEFTPTGDRVDDFFRLATVALACDAVRVIAMDARQLRGSVIGGADSDDVHQAFAHGDDARATMMMENYYEYHANQFASFIEYLRSVPEGDGTLLDNTFVIWLPELSTGSHMFDDTPTIIAGGGNTGFSPGRYIRYAQSIPKLGCNYGCDNDRVGPGHVHLFVNAMRHMGMSDNSFGRTSATARDGSTIDLTGPLSEVS